MRPRLAAVLLVLVVAPSALLAGLSWRLAEAERDAGAHRIQSVIAGLLRNAEAGPIGMMRNREESLAALIDGMGLDPADIRQRVARDPAVEMIFVVSPQGTLSYPTTSHELTPAERAFLERTGSLWDGKAFYHHARQPLTTDAGAGPEVLALQTQNSFQPMQQMQQEQPMQQSAAPPGLKGVPQVFLNAPTTQQAVSNYASLTGARSRGWYSWYWENALRLALFELRPNGSVAGVELNPTRLVADLIALLPEGDGRDAGMDDMRIVLADSTGRALYGWGGYLPPAGEAARVVHPLSPPLSGWRFEYFAPAATVEAVTSPFRVFAPAAGLGAALMVLALWFWRESTRDLREAATRITFVNQVSHELKTPLTNIRMYAELLENELPDNGGEDGTAHRYLGIVTTEIGRLSRLITNILTFSRSQRNKLSLNFAAARPDEVVGCTLEHFRPSLASAGVAAEFSAGAPGTALIDADALGQIVGNLLNNIEKYAAAGGCARMATRREGEKVVLTVADGGPGIPPGERERVFEAFHRVSSRLTDGVAGTGIGLTIARELARKHGGDLRLLASASGADFELTIHAPLAADGKESS